MTKIPASHKNLLTSMGKKKNDEFNRLKKENEELKAESKRFLEAANQQIKWKNEYKALNEKLQVEIMKYKLELDLMKQKYDLLGKSSSDLKAEFIGEFSWIEHHIVLNDCGDEVSTPIQMTVSWTMLKDIFKKMTEYVKNRDPKDYRP